MSRSGLGSGVWGLAQQCLLALCVLILPLQAQAAMAVETVSLGHGVKAWYVARDSVPMVELTLTFEGAGAATDPADKGGRAVFAAALLTQGAGELNAQQFAEALDARAITLSASANADQLTVRVRCLREHAARAGELLALALSKPTLAEEAITRVKNQQRSLLAQLDEKPEYLAQVALTGRAFQNHPYGNLPYGTAETLAGLSADDARRHYATYLTRGNLIISATGDVDDRLLKTMLGPVVDVLVSNDSGAVAVTKTVPQGGGEVLQRTVAQPQTVIAFLAPGIARNDQRFYAAFLLNHILGGGSLTSRLGMAIRQQDGLAYSVDTGLEARRGTALFQGELATRNASAAEALSTLKATLNEVRERGVTSEECASAKRYVLGHFPLQLDRSAAVTGMLTTMQLYGLGEDYMQARVKYFEDVSCADINAVAHEMLDPAKMLFAIVGGGSK